MVALGVLFALPSMGLAAPASAGRAMQVAQRWLSREARPMREAISGRVGRARSYRDARGQALYHVIALDPEGFVVVAADDRIEPIIAFAARGHFRATEDHPLFSLLQRDMAGRIWAVTSGPRSAGGSRGRVGAIRQRIERRWSLLEGDAGNRLQSSDDPPMQTLGLDDVSDVRVPPLGTGTWGQSTVEGMNTFNYYTPNHYYCGCVATVMAQLMRFHQRPVTGVGTPSFNISVDGVWQSRSLRGGNGSGGAYSWGQMPFDPDGSITLAQRQAIGALTYDAAVSVNMQFTELGSSASVWTGADRLVDTFGFGNAIKGYNAGNDMSAAVPGMVNPNLDAGYPVILAINRTEGGHAVICDGYGFQDDTPYHHLNMGWSGLDNAWYNLPDVDAYYHYTSIGSIIYNIYPEGSGELISGRVLDGGGLPVEGIAVRGVSGASVLSAQTDTRGVYALVGALSDTVYTVSLDEPGYDPATTAVSVGRSVDVASNAGNVWGVDLVASPLVGHGQLSIDVNPVAAEWTLTAYPLAYGGPVSGQGVLSDVLAPTGDYTVVYGALNGFATPDPQTEALEDGGSLVFSGHYDGIPVLQPIPSQVVGVGDVLTVSLSSYDPDQSFPVLTVDPLPTGAFFTDDGDGTGQIVWTPDSDALGLHTGTVYASDGRFSDAEAFAIRVFPAVPWPAANVVVDATRRPTFVWPTTAGATWYRLLIQRNGKTILDRWLQQAESVWETEVDLAGGSYAWWIKPWGPELGSAAWSPRFAFSIPVRTPDVAEPLAPGGAISESQPVFTWNEGSHASWYYLWVNREGNNYFSRWVQDTELMVEAPLVYGAYTWWVRTWNVDGYGPWSSPMAFTRGFCEALNPVGALVGGDVPSFTWTAVTGAQWYQVRLDKDAAVYLNPWVQGVTEWTPPDVLPFGSYAWQVRAWSAEGGMGPWSEARNFSVGDVVPLAPSADGLFWDTVWCPSATWYQVWLQRNGARYFEQWVVDSDVVHLGSMRHLALALPPGNYSLWLRAWSNGDGMGAWSETYEFDVE